MKLKINIPIWGLVNRHNEVVYWADTRKSVLENKWHDDEKAVPLQITERKTK